MTLEEKARKYSNYALAQDGYIAGYNEALRWRDVNVELPEKRDNDNSMIRVLVETKWNMLLLCVWCEHTKTFYSQIEDVDYTTEKIKRWRPIETI